MNYDYEIFISYRRDPDFPTAELLFRELEKRGFEGKVFLDVHKDEPGEFPDRLRNAVKASKHFILILSPKSLERCTQPGDWVAEEISIALEHKKNIIPVTTYRNFNFPEDLPGQLSVLKTYQRIELNFDFFDASIDKLISFIAPSLKDNINAKKDQSASSIQWDKIKPQFILMAISALALLLFFTGRKVTEIQVGDKDKYVTGKIASSMTPEIINGQLYFRAEYKGKHLTYNIANDEIGLNHADVTDKVNQFSSAEIILGSVFIANAGMWTYFKSLPSKLNFFKSRNKEAIITTAAVVVAVSAYFFGRYTVEKELKNPLDSGNIDLLKRNTSTLRRYLFDRYMNICTNNNFNDFDIEAIPSAHLKKAIEQSDDFIKSVNARIKHAKDNQLDFIPTENDFYQLFTRLSLYEWLCYGYFNYAENNKVFAESRYRYPYWSQHPVITRLIKEDNVRPTYYASRVVKIEDKESPKQNLVQTLTNFSLLTQVTKHRISWNIMDFGLLRLAWKYYNKIYRTELLAGDILIKCNEHYVISSDFRSQYQIFNSEFASKSSPVSLLALRPSTLEVIRIEFNPNQMNAYCTQVPIWSSRLQSAANIKKTVLITDITRGSCAEKYGIKRNDLLLAYADVELLSENNNERDVIQEFRDKEKKLIFARRMDNGSFKIFEQTFPAGIMGIHMQELWISGQEHKKLLDEYEKFKNK